MDLCNPWITLDLCNPWIALRLRNPGIAQVACAWAVFFMPSGMCQLTTNNRSIMVDQAVFDDFITAQFHGKEKEWEQSDNTD